MLYTVSSTGMTLQFHYCCGKLKNVEVTVNPTKEDCGKKHKMGSKASCETKQVSSDKDDFYSFSEYKYFKSLPAVSPRMFVFETAQLPVMLFGKSMLATGPPLTSTSLNILYSVFRI